MKRNIVYLLILGLMSMLYFACEDYTEDFEVPPPSTVSKFVYTTSNNLIPPDQLTFYNKSVIPDRAGTPTFYWDFDDGNTVETTDTASINHTFTVAGTYNVSLVVKTSVGDSSFYSAKIKLKEEIVGDTLLQEDFEESYLFPSDWVLINVDGNTPDNPNYASMADSAWIVVYSSTFQSNVALGNSFYNPEAAADDWMISPKITLGSSSLLIWQAMSLTTSGNYPDSYEVYISTTTQDINGCNASGFVRRYYDEQVGEDVGGEGIADHQLNLSQFAGQEVYIAFRLMTPNPGGDRLAIDNILVIQPN